MAMQVGDQDIDDGLRKGLDALAQGRTAEARRHFEDATASNPESAPAWLVLAQCCAADSDRIAEETAVDRLLEIDPQSVPGLILKGDCRASVGDGKLACHV